MVKIFHQKKTLFICVPEIISWEKNDDYDDVYNDYSLFLKGIRTFSWLYTSEAIILLEEKKLREHRLPVIPGCFRNTMKTYEFMHIHHAAYMSIFVKEWKKRIWLFKRKIS